ncbi:MAG: prolipoprotein diacylglyceryl transferase, partial [Desulfocapsa sp.]|nr:prolipoprotein diacylglyceryl transferase [Desulfocapsa sp.]
LYEMLLEGVLLFTILWALKSKPWKANATWPHGSMVSIFLICYGSFRMFVELFREPDQHIGFVLGVITRGQLLSGLMILSGAILWKLLQNQLQSSLPKDV